MTALPIVKVSDDADRATLEQAIKALRLKARRMPAHWVERRQQVADEIDELVARIVAVGR